MKHGKKLFPPMTAFLLAMLFLSAPFCKAADTTDENAVYAQFYAATGMEAQYDQLMNLMMNQVRRRSRRSFKEY